MKDRIVKELERHGGKLTYAQYMKMVLYDEEIGYYQQEREKIGKKGDFITTSHYSTLYGWCVYKWFQHLVKEEVIPPVFVELGPGDGAFLRSFYDAWEDDEERFPFTCYVVEKSNNHQKLIREKLPYNNLTIVEDFMPLPPLKGLVFSNELWDALPVHVLEKHGEKIYEVFIRLNESSSLEEIRIPITNSNLIDLINRNCISIKEGHRLEVSLEMLDLLKELNEKITGLFVTVDYGYKEEEFNQPYLKDGTLRGYYRHKLIRNPLSYPFKMDLTSHVNFSLYEKALAHLGWDLAYEHRQAKFLLDLGIINYLKSEDCSNPFSQVAKQNRMIRTLLMGGHISESFSVFIHSKGVQFQQDRLFSS
ncbi:SAM-dependent methyltransferase [Bacillus kexueae]|uniref:SAM-dependent methyltransferase n=1 Tax=Aeribacillus kexueae TaxID=2078952 RepID=UPI001FB0021B|nr:SAM-dependent methyltransferase [Bacillus kexueae]